MASEDPQLSVNEEGVDKEAADRERQEIKDQIKFYQRDRSQLGLRAELIDKVRERIIFLPREEFERLEEEDAEDPVPSKELWAFFSHKLDRPVINQDACPIEYQPYILAHESAEYIEADYEEQKTTEVSREFDPHEIGIKAEYTVAKKDGKLEKYHVDLMLLFDRWYERAKSTGNQYWIERLNKERAIRQRIFEEISGINKKVV